VSPTEKPKLNKSLNVNEVDHDTITAVEKHTIETNTMVPSKRCKWVKLVRSIRSLSTFACKKTSVLSLVAYSTVVHNQLTLRPMKSRNKVQNIDVYPRKTSLETENLQQKQGGDNLTSDKHERFLSGMRRPYATNINRTGRTRMEETSANKAKPNENPPRHRLTGNNSHALCHASEQSAADSFTNCVVKAGRSKSPRSIHLKSPRNEST